jgi:hypothetical protein
LWSRRLCVCEVLFTGTGLLCEGLCLLRQAGLL